MSIIFQLFLTFAKIGLFTFGGGYAMISMIENNCVEQKKWITHDEMMNVTVIAESTPGPIAINCATFVGCKQAGFLGALVATFGIIGIIMATGIFMIVNNVMNISAENGFELKALILTVVLAAVMFLPKPILKKKVSPIILIVISAVLGIMVYGIG